MIKDFLYDCILFKSKSIFNRCIGIYVWINILVGLMKLYTIYNQP